ncbi:EAL domain-containing protein [Noviherbaspirillum sp. CPCC 100848]|uniref:EAL domain-containing protein n=1 Tax=Noviherbaspirillum album TaxID=3080276 RepID=A0ABU6JF55_9BURK|nr:EAL domain-containing protein [Noviherbaspirillum sp. CPCC 100848]
MSRKLALIYFLDLSAVIFISGILIREKFIAINFAEKEVAGNQYIGVVRQALFAIPSVYYLVPPSDRPHVAAPLGAMQEKLERAEREFGKGLESAEIAGELAQLMRRAELTAPTASKTAHGDLDPTDIMAAGRALLTRVGNQSNLILDPDLDSYYTMSLVVLRFPELLEVLNAMHRLTRDEQDLAAEERQRWLTKFLILSGRLDAIVKGVDTDYSEAFAASTPDLRRNLIASQSALMESLHRFRAISHNIIGASPGSRIEGDPRRAYGAAVSSLQSAWADAQGELHRLLTTRIQGEFHRMWTHLGTAGLLLMVILSVVYYVARQIALPLGRVAHVAENVRRSGDYTLRAVWHSEDEIGRLVDGFNSMLEQLNRQRMEQQELVARARASEAQRKLVDSVPIPLLVTAIPHHQVLHANHAAQAWLNGCDTDPWKSGMEPDARIRFFQTLSDVGSINEFEVRWLGGLQPSWALVSARRVEYQGQPAVLSTFTPIGQIKSLESRLELWAKVFSASSEGILVMNAEGIVISANSAFCRTTSYGLPDLLGKHPGFLLAERNEKELTSVIRQTAMATGSWQGEVWITGKKEMTYPAWLVVNAVRDGSGDITHFIAISLDISDRKASEQHIHFLAHHDTLTSLPNRLLFEERLTLSIQQARRKNGKLGILFIDLDRFKNINDSLGHHVGDGLLRSVAARLVNAVREGDTVSRLGGDEFVIILNEVRDAEEIGRIIERRLIPMITALHPVEGAELYISCSIGVSVFPDDGSDIEQLMRNADSAMYEAKSQGRNNAQFFTQTLNDRIVQHLHLESELRHAVERDELVLHYQPRIHAGKGSVAGVECLLRWRHSAKGMMQPAQFIPIAEETGLIVPIGAWIIQQACRQHIEWREQGLGEIPISINLSAVQLRDAGLLPVLRAALATYPINARHIELELTESILMENVPTTIETLEAIKALGFSLSIDDFGTGYSSLNYLYRFPIDKLKIDRSFIRSMHHAPHSLTVTRAIIGLGHTLGLKVVAEGVEKESDVELLRAADCDELQGFYYSRPKPAEEIGAWLKSREVVFSRVPRALRASQPPDEPTKGRVESGYERTR